MKTKTFCELIERAVRELSDQEVEFETVPYLDDHGEPRECLGICLVKRWHFALIASKAMYLIWQDNDAEWNDDADKDEALGDFVDLVGTMRVAPYMQWTCIYFPGLTEEQVLGACDTDQDPLLIRDTNAGRDPVTGLMDHQHP